MLTKIDTEMVGRMMAADLRAQRFHAAHPELFKAQRAGCEQEPGGLSSEGWGGSTPKADGGSEI